MIVSREPGAVNKLKPSAPVHRILAHNSKPRDGHGSVHLVIWAVCTILYIVPVNSHFDRVLIFEFPAGQGAV